MAEAPKKPPRRRPRRSRHRSAVERVQEVHFPVVMRGYERRAVDRYVADVAQLVAELEATQTREGVVQRALDEIGEQTSGILQRAHETAEEIAARSRSQAEGRIQRAEKEADVARRDADAYADQIVTETRRLWADRQRLIEEMRQLADEVLGVADDALERVQEPRMDYADDTPQEGVPEGPPPEEAQPAEPVREAGPQAEAKVDPDAGVPADGTVEAEAGVRRKGNGSGDLDEQAAGERDTDQPTAEFPGPATQRGD
jgi:DivIVA domain-containing protein